MKETPSIAFECPKMSSDSQPEPTLHYVADPLCSWCWGFSSVIKQLEQRMQVRYRMGGLAPDSATPMDPGTKSYVRQAWDSVAQATGALFDRSLWDHATPRRSTWPACRAVIAAELQRKGAGRELFHRFQQAFYTEAIDVTDPDSFAGLGLTVDPPLDPERLELDLEGREVARLFEKDRQFAQEMEATGFPSLVLERAGEFQVLQQGWAPLERTLAALEEAEG